MHLHPWSIPAQSSDIDVAAHLSSGDQTSAIPPQLSLACREKGGKTADTGNRKYTMLIIASLRSQFQDQQRLGCMTSICAGCRLHANSVPLEEVLMMDTESLRPKYREAYGVVARRMSFLIIDVPRFRRSPKPNKNIAVQSRGTCSSREPATKKAASSPKEDANLH
jgi:hypothetical protein